MAANIFLTLPHHTVNHVRGHTVYLAPTWQADWQQVQWLFCEQVSWAIAPSISTATLVWRYGEGMRQGELQIGQVNSLTGRLGYYVMIEVETSDANAPLTWVGTVEIDARSLLGVLGMPGGSVPAARQTLACTGMEQILRLEPVRKSVWVKGTGEGVHTADRLFVFNQPDATGKVGKNRSENEFGGSFLFSSREEGPDRAWASRDIVKYLLAQHRPVQANGSVLPFEPDQDALGLVPNWDQPAIEQTSKTVGDLLDEVLPPGRGLSWHVYYDADEAIMRVAPVSLLGSVVPTPLGNLAANPRRLALEADGNPNWTCTPSGSSLARFHQVRVRSRRRTSTCTLSKADATFDKGWSDALKGDYQTAASGAPGYADWVTATKQRANTEARSSDKLRTVFARFQIVAGWTQTVKDGLGAGVSQLVFRQFEESNSVPYLVNPRELWIEQALALQDGYDYTNLGSVHSPTPPAEIAPAPHNHLRPLVIFKSPVAVAVEEEEVHRYVLAEKISTAAHVELAGLDGVVSQDNAKWHATVHVPSQDRAIFLNVSGAPQHVLAATEFVALPADVDQGDWDWHDMLVTVTLSDDRHCEGVYPDDSAINGVTGEARRTLLLDAGDKYRLDWLVPNTVIGVDGVSGELLRCVNGGWIRDDRKLLASRARQAFDYYQRPRQQVSIAGLDLDVGRLVRIGDYLESWGTPATTLIEAGAVISQVTIDLPSGQPGAVAAPTIHFQTAFAELDPTVFLMERPS